MKNFFTVKQCWTGIEGTDVDWFFSKLPERYSFDSKLINKFQPLILSHFMFNGIWYSKDHKLRMELTLEPRKHEYVHYYRESSSLVKIKLLALFEPWKLGDKSIVRGRYRITRFPTPSKIKEMVKSYRLMMYMNDRLMRSQNKNSNFEPLRAYYAKAPESEINKQYSKQVINKPKYLYVPEGPRHVLLVSSYMSKQEQIDHIKNKLRTNLLNLITFNTEEYGIDEGRKKDVLKIIKLCDSYEFQDPIDEILELKKNLKNLSYSDKFKLDVLLKKMEPLDDFKQIISASSTDINLARFIYNWDKHIDPKFHQMDAKTGTYLYYKVGLLHSYIYSNFINFDNVYHYKLISTGDNMFTYIDLQQFNLDDDVYFLEYREFDKFGSWKTLPEFIEWNNNRYFYPFLPVTERMFKKNIDQTRDKKILSINNKENDEQNRIKWLIVKRNYFRNDTIFWDTLTSANIINGSIRIKCVFELNIYY